MLEGICVSVQKAHRLVHDGGKALCLLVLATRDWRELSHLSSKIFRLFYSRYEVTIPLG
jgi:hypothetical protein